MSELEKQCQAAARWNSDLEYLRLRRGPFYVDVVSDSSIQQVYQIESGLESVDPTLPGSGYYENEAMGQLSLKKQRVAEPEQQEVVVEARERLGYECSFCTKVCASSLGLKQHHKAKHKGIEFPGEANPREPAPPPPAAVPVKLTPNLSIPHLKFSAAGQEGPAEPPPREFWTDLMRRREQNRQPVMLISPSFRCLICENSNHHPEMLTCNICSSSYHSVCLQLNQDERSLAARKKQGWLCDHCKKCYVCGSSGDDSRLVVCEDCDQAIHVYCNFPKIPKVPKKHFRCRQCAKCVSCGRKDGDSYSVPKWQRHYTQCDACFQLINKGRYCSVCKSAWRLTEEIPMLACDGCKFMCHVFCDKTVNQEKFDFFKTVPPSSKVEGYRYFCPQCVKKRGLPFAFRH